MNIEKSSVLNTLETTIGDHLDLAIQQFQNLPELVLLYKPESGAWSLAECLWHLNSYSEYYHPAIQKAMDTTKKGNSSSDLMKSSWLGRWFTSLMKPGKGKYSAFPGHRPPAKVLPAETVAAFIQHQEQLTELIRKARQTDISRIRIPISINRFVSLPLADVFEFVVTHNERHIQQGLRALPHDEKVNFRSTYTN